MTPADCATGRAVLVEAMRHDVLCASIGAAVLAMRNAPSVDDTALIRATQSAALALVQAHQRLEAERE